jgi:enterochelin esterase-like enzyme
MRFRSVTERSRPVIWGAICLLVGCIILLLYGVIPTAILVPAGTSTPVCSEEGIVRRERIDSQTLEWPLQFEYYLPPCYEQQIEVTYPVVYLIPGNGSGFLTWNRQGNASEIADEMIRQGEIEPFILVTTGNYSSDTGGAIFLNDLIPYIDDHLRTREGRRYRVVGGASLGGVVAYRMTFQHPEIFGSVGVFGSGVIEGEEEVFAAWLEEISAEEMPRVLIDYGEDDFFMKRNAQLMMEILEERGVLYTLNVEPGDHSYSYWSGNLEMYLRWYAEDW